ncbi:MAG: hypothetical protein LBU34_02170 [Planctomycetaceae bacterium]|nr:hypothetical protein [Planctomycetaceae bacterium]
MLFLITFCFCAELCADTDKYIDQANGVQLMPPEEIVDLYLSNVAQDEKRNNVFRLNCSSLSCSSLWMPDSGNEGLGLVQTDVSVVLALPLLSEKLPLMITPSFSHKQFDHKSYNSLDLYNTGVNFRLLFPVIDRKLSFDTAVSVLYCGTFEGGNRKSMCYPLHVAGIWNVNSQLKLVFGVAHLDRNNEYNWLPIGGLIWMPNPDFNVELLFPAMKIARRLTYFDRRDTGSKQNFTGWVYGMFEFDNGSWNYVKKGIEAKIDYSDVRFIIGYEHRCASGITFGVESGCAIGREFEVQGLPKYKPDTGFFIKLRVTL